MAIEAKRQHNFKETDFEACELNGTVSAPLEKQKIAADEKHQICEEQGGDVNTPQINARHKHKCHILIMFSTWLSFV